MRNDFNYYGVNILACFIIFICYSMDISVLVSSGIFLTSFGVFYFIQPDNSSNLSNNIPNTIDQEHDHENDITKEENKAGRGTNFDFQSLFLREDESSTDDEIQAETTTKTPQRSKRKTSQEINKWTRQNTNRIEKPTNFTANHTKKEKILTKKVTSNVAGNLTMVTCKDNEIKNMNFIHSKLKPSGVSNPQNTNKINNNYDDTSQDDKNYKSYMTKFSASFKDVNKSIGNPIPPPKPVEPTPSKVTPPSPKPIETQTPKVVENSNPKPQNPVQANSSQKTDRKPLQMPPGIFYSHDQVKQDLTERRDYFEKNILHVVESNKKPADLKEPLPFVYGKINLEKKDECVKEILSLISNNPNSPVYFAHYWKNVCERFFNQLKRTLSNKRLGLPKIDAIYDIACASSDFALIFDCFLCYKYPHVRGILQKEPAFPSKNDFISHLEDIEYGITVYGLLLNKSDKPNSKNPFGGMEMAWTWLAAVANNPVTDSTAHLIKVFLDTSGFYLQHNFPKQFPKLIDSIRQQVVPLILDYAKTKNPDTESYALRLQDYLKKPEFKRFEIIVDT